MGQKQHVEFRTLRPDEIECRVQSVFRGDKGFKLLLYKDARCDMNILDETVGTLNWQREHSDGNHNCTVKVWNEDRAEWICKEDTGTESNTEAAKGLASDSFKRACVNLGIGRELYSSPDISIFETKYISKGTGGKAGKVWEKFKVTHIAYDEGRKITELVISDEAGNKVFEFPKGAAKSQQSEAENKVRKHRGKVLEALDKYELDDVLQAAENVGEEVQSNDTLVALLNRIPTVERMNALGMECKEHASLKAPSA